MGNLNKVLLIGRLVRDPELSYTTKGTSYCRVTLAITKPYKNGNGKDSDFLDVSIWKNQAEACAQYMKRGSEIFIEGSLQKNSWEKDGKRRSSLQITAQRVQFLGKKKAKQEEENIKDDKGDETSETGNGSE